MTDIIALAKQAGASSYTNRHYPDRTFASFSPEMLQAFAELIRQDEREKCAVYIEQFNAPGMHFASIIRARTTT